VGVGTIEKLVQLDGRTDKLKANERDHERNRTMSSLGPVKKSIEKEIWIDLGKMKKI